MSDKELEVRNLLSKMVSTKTICREVSVSKSFVDKVYRSMNLEQPIEITSGDWEELQSRVSRLEKAILQKGKQV